MANRLHLSGIINVANNISSCNMNSMIVYLYTNLLNGKCYVGITSVSLSHRMGQHPSDNTYFGRALRKHGKNAFKVEVIDEAYSKEELAEKERYWIAKLNTMSPVGYNLTTGGDGMYQLSPESCKKISLSKIGLKRPDVKPEDLTGRRFGRLIAIRLAAVGPARWWCKCDCGKEHNVSSIALKNGNTKSCGCLRREATSVRKFKYGTKNNPLYTVWLRISKCDSGICERWMNSFENFAIDMSDRLDGAVLFRRDKTKQFSKENCFWGTRAQLSRNSSRTVLLEADGKLQTQTEWKNELKINQRRISKAIKDGIPFQKFVEALRAERAI